MQLVSHRLRDTILCAKTSLGSIFQKHFTRAVFSIFTFYKMDAWSFVYCVKFCRASTCVRQSSSILEHWHLTLFTPAFNPIWVMGLFGPARNAFTIYGSTFAFDIFIKSAFPIYYLLVIYVQLIYLCIVIHSYILCLVSTNLQGDHCTLPYLY
jgi:hypothetical protein